MGPSVDQFWRGLQRLPEAVRKRLAFRIESDPYGLNPRVTAVELHPGCRKFECNLTDDWKLPEEFVAHLCAVV